MTEKKQNENVETTIDDTSDLHTDTNAGPDAVQDTISSQKAEGKAPERSDQV